MTAGDITMQAYHEPDAELICTWTFASNLDDVGPMLSMDVSSADPTTTADFVETTKGELGIIGALEQLSAVSADDITIEAAHEPDVELTCTWTFSSELGDVSMLSMDISSADPTTTADFVETTKGENNWTHVVFVYDSNNTIGTGTVYINGEQAGQVEYDVGRAQQIGSFSMGAYRPDGGKPRWFLDGWLDDVRFYAYPITAVNVASLYNEITWQMVCPGIPGADVNDSCIVELADYVNVLSNWLACNIVPASGNCP